MTNAISSKNILTGNQPSLASKFLSMLEDARISPSDKSLSSIKKQALSQGSVEPILPAKILSGHSDDWNITLHSNGDITLTERVNDGRGKPGEVITINKKDYSQIKFSDHEEYYIAGFGFPAEGEPPVRISNSMGVYQRDKSNGLYRNEEDNWDVVSAGGGNDQFRTKGKMGGDLFQGGGGVDTLYLDGKKEDYNFNYVYDAVIGDYITISREDDPKNYMFIGNDVERLRFSDGGIKKGTDKRGFVKISEVINTVYSEKYPLYLDIENINSKVSGTQTNDFFAWSGEVGHDLEAGWGKDTLKLGGQLSDYNFTFIPAKEDAKSKASLLIVIKKQEILSCVMISNS